MSPPSLKATAPRLDVRDARASSVIVHRVAAGVAEDFLDWEAGITEAARAFPGYRGTDLYPPAGDGPGEWVVIVHFDEAANLGRWLESPERAEWAARLPEAFGGYRLRTLPTGFGPWFAARLDDPGGRPASWKMALTVLLGLYPTVMILSLAFGSSLAPLGPAGSMLVGNVLSVSILQWAVMPPLQRILGPWLTPGAGRARIRPAACLAGLLLVLCAQLLVFRRIGG